jgi:hypothetical protein
VVVLAGALVAAAFLATGSTGEEHTSTAQAAADDLLGGVTVPGGTRSSDEPDGTRGLLATRSMSTSRPQAAVAHAWWVVPNTDPQAVLDAITAAAERDLHAQGAEVGGSWGTDGPILREELVDVPPVPRAPGARQLVLAAMRLPGGSVAVRVDAAIGAPTTHNDDDSAGAVSYAPLNVKDP